MTCAIDGDTIPLEQPPPNSDVNEWLSWRVVYDNNLSKGNHTLLCDVVEASTYAPFRLSSFGLYPSELPQLLIEGNLSDEPTTSEVHPSSTSSVQVMSPTSNSMSDTKSPAPVGAIVGGVLAGLVGIGLLVVIAALFLRRRGRGRYAYVGGHDDDGTYLYW